MKYFLFILFALATFSVLAQDTVFYKIEKDETLYKVSKIYDISVSDLQKQNNLEETNVNPGQVIKVYKKTELTPVEIDLNTTVYNKELLEKEKKENQDYLDLKLEDIKTKKATLDNNNMVDLQRNLDLSKQKVVLVDSISQVNSSLETKISAFNTRISQLKSDSKEIDKKDEEKAKREKKLKEEKEAKVELERKKDEETLAKKIAAEEKEKKLKQEANNAAKKEKTAEELKRKKEIEAKRKKELKEKLVDDNRQKEQVENEKVLAQKEAKKKLNTLERAKSEEFKKEQKAISDQKKLEEKNKRDIAKAIELEKKKAKEAELAKISKKKSKDPKIKKEKDVISSKVIIDDKIVNENNSTDKKHKPIKKKKEVKKPVVKDDDIVVFNADKNKKGIDSLKLIKKNNNIFLKSKLKQIEEEKSKLNIDLELQKVLALSKEKFVVSDSINSENKAIDLLIKEKRVEAQNSTVVQINEPKPKKIKKVKAEEDELETLDFGFDNSNNIDTNTLSKAELKEFKKSLEKDAAITRNVETANIKKSKKKKKYVFGDEVEKQLQEKAKFFLSRAKSEIDNQNITKAKDFIDKSLALNPSYSDAYTLKGDIFSSLSYFDKALNQYKKASLLSPENAQLHYNMGNCFIRMERDDLAIKEWTKAIEIDDNYILAYAGRASLFMKNKQFNQALEDYNKIFSINKYFYVAYKGRGVAHLELGNFGKAIIDFNNFLEFEADDAYIYWKRGLAKLYDNEIYGGCMDLLSSSQFGNKDAERALKNTVKNKPIILFDGVCVLCNNSVHFILKHEKNPYYHFASLQSNFGQTFLKTHNLSTKDLDSIVLFENNQISTKSTAILKVSKQLNKPFNFASILLFIPSSIRNFIYNVIAKNRYSWFGKDENCLYPDATLKDRLLD